MAGAGFQLRNNSKFSSVCFSFSIVWLFPEIHTNTVQGEIKALFQKQSSVLQTWHSWAQSHDVLESGLRTDDCVWVIVPALSLAESLVFAAVIVLWWDGRRELFCKVRTVSGGSLWAPLALTLYDAVTLGGGIWSGLWSVGWFWQAAL